MADRDFDVVVFGATGVTGRRVAGYLAGQNVRWAAAGRDGAKVASVLAEEGVTAPETIVADTGDGASLLAMARRTGVVLNLVGPYTRYARPVIEACVTGAAHYADVTGEIPFVRRMIDEFDVPAREAGVKVVQVAGFESLPADLCVLLAAEAARKSFGEPLDEVDLVARAAPPPGLPRPSDVLSGGTMQSIAEIAGSDRAEQILDPAVLIDDADQAEAVRRRSPITIAPRRADGDVIAPMAPAAYINPAVIHRTHALLSAGESGEVHAFRYREGMAIPGGGGAATLPLRYVAAGAMSGLQASIRGLTRLAPERRRAIGRRLGNLLPDSGFGPAADRLEGWRWSIEVQARTASGREVTARVDASGHPGYLATSRMLGEAGILMSEPGTTPERAGCLTPAVALGAATAPRFERAQARFSVSARS